MNDVVLQYLQDIIFYAERNERGAVVASKLADSCAAAYLRRIEPLLKPGVEVAGGYADSKSFALSLSDDTTIEGYAGLRKARLLTNDRWPEAEPIIARDAKLSYRYLIQCCGFTDNDLEDLPDDSLTTLVANLPPP